MPELPEVETIRNDLNQKIIHKRIKSIAIRKKKIVKNTHRLFKDKVVGSKFNEIDRVGKLMIINLDNGLFILVHLRMTGQLIYQQAGKRTIGGHNWPESDQELPNRFSHIIVTFSDNSKLFFNDMRQFGYWHLVNDQERQKAVSSYGIEPIAKDFTLDKFEDLLKNRKSVLKPFLLNQKFMACIGNIYADEICFAAKVKPSRLIHTLKRGEKELLHKACRDILIKGIKYRGTTFSDYVDSDGHAGNFVKFLKVFGRTGESCKRCKKGTIQKIKLGGRGTHFCPQCQK